MTIKETTTTDADIDNAAAAADAAASNTASAGDDDHKEPTSVKGMVSVMRKHSDGTNVIKESIKTFSNPDGSDKKDDKWVKSKEEGITLVTAWVEAAKSDSKVKAKKRIKWNFETSPHAQFDKTIEDLYAMFVHWARAEDGDKDYNISKAFRRLESYADWMHENGGTEISEPPLTIGSVQTCLEAWGMRSSISKSNQLVWWFDMGTIDMSTIKTKYTVTEHMRAFVWYAHAIMYNPNAQEHGIVFCEDVAKLGFIQSITLMPAKLSSKLDRLTIGVLPVRMTGMYLLSTPRWMDLFMKFMGMFMSKKMKDRMHPLKDSEWDKLEANLGGKDYILKGFGRLEGTLEADPIKDAYYTSKP